MNTGTEETTSTLSVSSEGEGDGAEPGAEPGQIGTRERNRLESLKRKRLKRNFDTKKKKNQNTKTPIYQDQNSDRGSDEDDE